MRFTLVWFDFFGEVGWGTGRSWEVMLEGKGGGR